MSKARQSIDPAYAVKVDDLLSDFAKWQQKLFSRFGEPAAKTATSKKSGDPVQAADGKWMKYSAEGIRCYHRVTKASMKLWEELACLRNGAEYASPPEGYVEMKPKKKGKKRKRS
jgi:hypothetical protein